MKFKVIFLSKRNIFIALFFIFLFLTLIFVYKLFSQKSYDETSMVMAKKDIEKGVKKDFNGDGNEDVLYITTKENKYYASINIKDKSYMLSPDKEIGSLGKEYPYWGMRLFVRDISRDGIPEIFLQSSQEGTPISHIFRWNGTDFDDIHFSKNNIVGILNSKNNKTPKIFSGSIINGVFSFESYMLIGTNFKDISYEASLVPGKDEVIKFIDIIESPYEPSELPNIFSNSISRNDTALLWKLEKELYTYSLQDIFFVDTDWDNNGNISSVMWELNFKKVDKSTDKANESITVRISLEYLDSRYNISSISYS